MIGRYGPGVTPALEAIEQRISNHLRKLVGNRVPLSALTLLQAPVFHAYTFALHVELEQAVSLGDLSRVLGGEHVQIARNAEDAPSNVNVAGKDDILVALRRDPAENSTGVWIWAAVDNLRLAAITAVDCANALAAVRPHGKVQ
jgi:aspartate-semialdehyde dehydrogenase